MTLSPELRQKCVNTIRFLAVDAVEKAKSGHPGTPMGAADLAFTLWYDHLLGDPAAPDWPGRDRFVLSAGHASMLLYALLHCAGYDLPLDEIKRFRQWGSKTPGHPEYGHTAGVEVTTGPLGAGFATGVGMALGAKMLAARFNADGFPLVAHHVYGVVSDGDLFEGVSAEAASLAGHLGLGNLVYLYDDNGITIEGDTSLAFAEDVAARFTAYQWFVQRVDGHDHAAVSAALTAAKAQTTRPSLIVCKTRIGFGSEKAGTHEVHGAPLGAADVAAAKRRLGWPPDASFLVPDDVRAAWAARAERMRARRAEWESMVASWRQANPDAARLWDAHQSRAVPADLAAQLAAHVGSASEATRVLSGKAIQKACALVPSLLGGSADLAPSTGTAIKGAGEIVSASVASDEAPDPSFAGKNLHFGVREHAMGSVANGMVLHGGWRVYNATFLVFSDYMRPPVRLAALMRIPTIFVFTHDSFWVGEDGPTHQPIEHLWSLRLIPDLKLWRPADGIETAVAWAQAVASERTPHVLIFTRQKTAALDAVRPAGFTLADVERGGYVVADCAGAPAVTIVATGSEVGAAVEARALLGQEGVAVRVVSMPCVEAFCAQPRAYRDAVIPPSSRKVSVEAGRTGPWRAIIGADGLAIGLDHFGASAPGPELADRFGFTGPKVAERIRGWLKETP